MNKMSGAQAVVEVLHKEGVDVVFGIPGGANMPIYDVLHDYQNLEFTPREFKGIRHVLARHEQSAAHMADGYARASGKVGVCLATSGPGATNLLTGLATAYMDSSPIVAITAQIPSYLIGSDGFQEADVVGMSTSVTKYAFPATARQRRPVHAEISILFSQNPSATTRSSGYSKGCSSSRS